MNTKLNIVTRDGAANTLTLADLAKVVGGQQGGANMDIGNDWPKTTAPVYPALKR